MREILFKGKRKDWRELPKEEWWVEGMPMYFDDRSFIVTNLGINCIEDTEPDKFIQLHAFEVIPETVCQYTGLTDKSGKKIFDGDIVKTKFFGKCRSDFNFADYDIFKIIYDKGAFYFENSTRKFLINERAKAEIIGNIFDNPELLEVQE